MPHNKHFNKELYEISKNDLEKYFSEDREETSTLEFKSGKVEIDKIYREICAFLNTEGGSLIIGTPIEKKVVEKLQEKKVYKGKLVPSKFRDKDWLTQKISSNIVPLPASVRIHEIDLKTGKVFIIDIPKSQNPPHQCSNDGKFYIRMETESKPAPHGIVKALFNQVKAANLIVNFDVKTKGKHRIKAIAQLSNRNLMPAEDVNVHLAVYAEKLYVEDEADNLLRRNLHNGFTAIETTRKIQHSLVSMLTANVSAEVICHSETLKLMVVVWCKNTEASHFVAEYDLEKGKITQLSSPDEYNESLMNKMVEIIKVGNANNANQADG